VITPTSSIRSPAVVHRRGRQHLLVRRGAQDLEIRSKREETMRNLRRAAELAVSDDSRTAQLGVAELNALAESNLLEDSQLLFVDAAVDAVIEEPEDAIVEATDDVDVELSVTL
jgi:hypothetical protein